MSQDADTLASAFGEADEAVDLSGVMPEAWLALAFFW
ncbi:MAG: TRAP transporter small permease, partial [Betaproteobacteria bacterium]|nr:TRAP transporter small permease [Betaproteobacteria bacterium]